MQFQIVDRPVTLDITDPLIQALVETAETGKALQVPMVATDLIPWQAKVRGALRDQGLKLCYRMKSADNTVLCWAFKDPRADLSDG